MYGCNTGGKSTVDTFYNPGVLDSGVNPTLKSLSAPVDGLYSLNQSLTFVVEYDQNIYVSGTP